jgi:two-component system, NarL family, invasion response regulator UvrY
MRKVKADTEIKVLLVHSQPIVRRGLRLILAEEFPKTDIVECSNVREALSLAETRRPELVILNLVMEGKEGLETLKALRHKHPDLPILVLGIDTADHLALRTLRAGANCYLSKESTPEELVKAIRKILKGGKYVSQDLAESLVQYLEAETDRPIHETLSDREYQVLLMIASGKRVTEIAEELSLSVKTISSYRSRLLEKMGMKTNAGLTHYVHKNRLVN